MSISIVLVRRAAERWPAEIRDEMAAEWIAELATMRRERVPGWRRLAYAVSLATSAPVEDPGEAPRLWREELPSIGRAVAVLVGFAVVAWSAALAAAEVPAFARFLLVEAQGDYPGTYVIGQPTSVQWGADAVSVAALLLTAVGYAVLGAYVGRVAPLRWAGHIGFGPAGPGVVAALVVGTAAGGAHGVGLYGDRVRVGPTIAVYALSAILVATVVRVAPRGRPLVAVVGGLATLDIAGAIIGGSPWWFPLSLLDLEHSGVAYGDPFAYHENVGAVAAVVRPALLCAVFLLRYAVRAASTAPVTEARRPTPVRLGDARPAPVRRAVAVVLMTSGLGLWAYSAAWLTPAIEAIHSGDSDPGELHIWIQEQRELAIWLVVVGLILAMLRRGPIALPAVVAYAGMFVADCVADARGSSGPRAFEALVLVGAALLGGAWWLSARLAVVRADPLVTRRVAVAVAVSAALTAPTLCIDFEYLADFRHPPAGLLPSACAIMVLLWFAAMAVACSPARRSVAPRRAVAAYTLVPLILVSGLEVWPEGHEQALALVAAGALGLLALAASCGPVRIRPWRWIGLAVASVPASVAYLLMSIVIAMSIGGTLMAAAGFDYPSDGVPLMPGALPVGIGLGMLCAPFAVPTAPAPIAIEMPAPADA
jgi:hypothetical protein